MLSSPMKYKSEFLINCMLKNNICTQTPKLKSHSVYNVWIEKIKQYRDKGT
jgi:hypothetical protein